MLCSKSVGVRNTRWMPNNMQTDTGTLDGFSLVVGFHMLWVFTCPVEEVYLWGMVSTDGRAEHRVNQKLEGIANPPGSTLIGKASDGSKHLLQ